MCQYDLDGTPRCTSKNQSNEPRRDTLRPDDGSLAASVMILTPPTRIASGRSTRTPRDSAIPEHLLSDDFLHDIDGDVRALHGQVFNGIRDELIENYGSNPIWVVVEPDVEDRTTSVLCTDRSLLLMHSSKACQFFWTTEEAAAEVGPLIRRHRSTLTTRQAAESRDGTKKV